MNDKTVIFGILLVAAAAAAFAYVRLTGSKNFDAVHAGMVDTEVIAKIGEPNLKTNQAGITLWFYGIKNLEEHKGDFGLNQYAFNTDLAVVFAPDGKNVSELDRATDKQWIVSLKEPPRNK
jgi:hypothetical protein